MHVPLVAAHVGLPSTALKMVMCVLIMFSLYRISDNKARRFCRRLCFTGRSGH